MTSYLLWNAPIALVYILLSTRVVQNCRLVFVPSVALAPLTSSFQTIIAK